MPCPPHTDSGLVTVIPCAKTPELEVLDWQQYKWQATEQGADHPVEVVVLLGETIARLTCMHLQASVHRVIRKTAEEERFSLPFQLRGSPSAVLDSVGLNSPVIENIPRSCRATPTIAEFIQ